MLLKLCDVSSILQVIDVCYWIGSTQTKLYIECQQNDNFYAGHVSQTIKSIIIRETFVDMGSHTITTTLISSPFCAYCATK